MLFRVLKTNTSKTIQFRDLEEKTLKNRQKYNKNTIKSVENSKRNCV